MIVFVGDKSSSKNVDPKVPFVGTQSYKRLLEWIWEMDIDISQVVTTNIDQLSNDWGKGFAPEVHTATTTLEILDGDKVIALGNKAEKHLETVYINKYFKLPHPSGLNRQNNDKKFIKQKLKECKEWLNG